MNNGESSAAQEAGIRSVSQWVCASLMCVCIFEEIVEGKKKKENWEQQLN